MREERVNSRLKFKYLFIRWLIVQFTEVYGAISPNICIWAIADIWYILISSIDYLMENRLRISELLTSALCWNFFSRSYSTWESWFLLIEKFNFKLLSSSVVRASDFETINQSRVSSSLTESRYAFEWLARAPSGRVWVTKVEIPIDYRVRKKMNYAREIKTRWTLKWLIKWSWEMFDFNAHIIRFDGP